MHQLCHSCRFDGLLPNGTHNLCALGTVYHPLHRTCFTHREFDRVCDKRLLPRHYLCLTRGIVLVNVCIPDHLSAVIGPESSSREPGGGGVVKNAL